MTTVSKFPSISQFRDTIRNIRNQASYDGKDENGDTKFKQVVFPTLSFFGTTKAHGTNAALRNDCAGGEIIYQSRERIITPIDDNAGFAAYMHSRLDFVKRYIAEVRDRFNVPAEKEMIVFGEWCGGNIQKGVAINNLDKMFLIFAIRIGTADDSTWIRPDCVLFDLLENTPNKFYPITLFGTYEIDINFNKPELVQNQLVELTTKVGDECPIGKYFLDINDTINVQKIDDEILYSKPVPDHVKEKVNQFVTKNLNNGECSVLTITTL